MERDGENFAGDVCTCRIGGLDTLRLSVGGRARQKGLNLRIERSHLRDVGDDGREEYGEEYWPFPFKNWPSSRE